MRRRSPYFSRFNRKIPSLEELKSHLGEKDPETETVLLAHNPMFFSVYKEWGADLTFSGHLHGGYIRIPGIGGVISPQFQLFPKYDRGIFEEEGHYALCQRRPGRPHDLAAVFQSGGASNTDLARLSLYKNHLYEVE
ncbi:MAG: hypothetical protein ACLR2E_06790 [Lachnospiraceae bacterium]